MKNKKVKRILFYSGLCILILLIVGLVSIRYGSAIVNYYYINYYDSCGDDYNIHKITVTLEGEYNKSLIERDIKNVAYKDSNILNLSFRNYSDSINVIGVFQIKFINDSELKTNIKSHSNLMKRIKNIENVRKVDKVCGGTLQ